jgi:hypothetical protein
MEWFNRVVEEIKSLEVIKKANSHYEQVISEDVIKVEVNRGERHPSISVYEIFGGQSFVEVFYDPYNEELYIKDEIKIKGDDFYQVKIPLEFSKIKELIQIEVESFIKD